MGHRSCGVVGKNDAKPCYCPACMRLSHAAQPEQRKRQTVVNGVRGFTGRRRQNCMSQRTPAKQTTCAVSGERMLQVRGNRKGFDSIVRKLLGEKGAQLLA